MRQTLKWSGLILLAIAAGLVLAVLATAGVRAQSPVSQAQLQATAAPFSGSGMMGSWRSGRANNGPAGGYTPTQAPPYSAFGPGMMDRWRSGYGSGMMGGWFPSGAWRKPDHQTPLTLDQAVEAARRSLVSYGNPDLQLTEVMEFTNNFYVEVAEKSTGIHAFELLVDRYTGAAYPEPGPNMIWNTQYGHMGSMMGGGWGQAVNTVSVTSEQARNLAQKWLDQNRPGTAAAAQADTFHGYYTIHVLKEGQVFGMLSVNAYTGEVWYHTWHGDFIDLKELEE